MSGASKIEWTDKVWNPVTGCTKVSQGCKHCYAERQWSRLAAPRPKPNAYTGRAFTDVQCHPERLNWPLRKTKPLRIFVNSMSDLFHDQVSDRFIEMVFAVMAGCPQHQFQILTKRPERMRDFCERLPSKARNIAEDFNYLFPTTDPDSNYDAIHERIESAPLPNVWLGVSIKDQATANERIPILLETPAAVRWVSAEPLLGAVNLRLAHAHMRKQFTSDLPPTDGGLDWVVVGGESGPKARPMHPDWVRSLRDQCKAAGVPFLFKQWGEWAPANVGTAAGRGKAYIFHDGTTQRGYTETGQRIARVGKSKAGRMLDGVLHDEYPA